jgi:hypothetical protein
MLAATEVEKLSVEWRMLCNFHTVDTADIFVRGCTLSLCTHPRSFKTASSAEVIELELDLDVDDGDGDCDGIGDDGYTNAAAIPVPSGIKGGGGSGDGGDGASAELQRLQQELYELSGVSSNQLPSLCPNLLQSAIHHRAFHSPYNQSPKCIRYERARHVERAAVMNV